VALTQDYTYQLGDAGVLLNSDLTLLPFVDIDTLSGMDSPNFRESQRDHEGVDGDFLDAEFETGRDIALSGTVYTDPNDPETYLDSLRFNFQPSRTLIPFYFKSPNKPERVLFVKPRGVRYDINSLRRTGLSAIQFLMHAEDPRIYTSLLRQVVLSAGSTITLGRGYNKSYNYGYGTIVTVPDSFTVTNGGNRDAPALITITGPVTTPQIVSDTAGMTLTFNITLGVSDVLVIDLLNHTVVLNGSTNRRNTLLAPNWFLLKPGDNILRYRTAIGSVTTATVSWRDTWR
jgi:hypothetical protein